MMAFQGRFVAAVLLVTCVCFETSFAKRELTQSTATVRYCIPAEPSDDDVLESCNEAIAKANTAAVEFSCVIGSSPEGCISAISSGDAEITTLGASAMPLAAENEIFPIVAEFYGDEDGALTEYYAVAVVPEQFCENPNVDLKDLEGLRACHTGFRRTSGWNIPVGALVETGVMPVVNEITNVTADAESIASFFSGVCAPGTTEDGPVSGGNPWDGLCSACGGDCSSEDPYAGYPGTLRGLMEGACDVAFTKQDIVPMYAADGESPEAWATGSMDDFRLLCPGGGCAAADAYQKCNLGKVPAKAIVSAANNPSNNNIANALVAAGNDPKWLASATNIEETENVIFSEGTEAVLRVDIPYEEFFDAATQGAFEAVRELESLSP